MLRDGTNVPLRSKTFAVLEYLASHPDRLVTRDELLDAVWGQTHITPSVLAGCICELRHALGDDARAARFIETAHRRGYRFVALAGEVCAARPSSPPEPAFPDVELATLARRFAEVVTRLIEQRRRAAGVHRPHKPGRRTAAR